VFTITLLGSGSAGNSALIETDRTRVLVDGGLSARQLTARLAAHGVTPEMLNGILLTHEHTDHVSALRVLCKKTPVPIYCTRLTAEELRQDHLADHPDVRQFLPGADFEVGDLGVRTFRVQHDAVDPVGFTFFHGSASLGFLTDLGKCTTLARERVRGAGTLVIEANHDEKMLQNDTRRTWSLKQRIMSSHGHLSNAAAAREIVELLEHGLRRVILCHLSRDCNTPEVALRTVREHVPESAVEVHCAAQETASARFEMDEI